MSTISEDQTADVEQQNRALARINARFSSLKVHCSIPDYATGKEVLLSQVLWCYQYGINLKELLGTMRTLLLWR
jgi:hypothetical protein